MTIFDVKKQCLWCGKDHATHKDDSFPRHKLCEQEMDDKGVMPSLATAEGVTARIIYHRRSKLRIELKPDDIARNVWKVYENTEMYNINNPLSTVRGGQRKAEAESQKDHAAAVATD